MIGRASLALALAIALLTSVQAKTRTPSLGASLALYGKGSVPACATCHGLQGQGKPHFAYPRLAGLGAGYLSNAMRAFVDGRRLNGIMTPIARALGPQEVGAVVAYYAAFRARPSQDVGRWSPNSLAEGKRLYEHGDLVDKLPACARCHGARGEGLGARFPWLAGQSEGYVKERLRSFRAGARGGVGPDLMRAAVRPLTDRQIEVISQYVSIMNMRPLPPLHARSPHSALPVLSHPFIPPRRADMPSTPFGQAALHGRALFDHTRRYARAYVHSALSCSDCHLGQGRMAYAAPLWAAATLYPRLYRGRMTTLGARMQAAFVHSERGIAPPSDSPVLTDLQAYVHWMSRGARLGAHMPGRGYPALPAARKPPDAKAGALLYRDHCAICHGATGQGLRVHGHLAFPPVWGRLSFGHQASLAHLPLLAAFLRATMPFGKAGTLRVAQAYDLASFLLGRPRPR